MNFHAFLMLWAFFCIFPVSSEASRDISNWNEVENAEYFQLLIDDEGSEQIVIPTFGIRENERWEIVSSLNLNLPTKILDGATKYFLHNGRQIFLILRQTEQEGRVEQEDEDAPQKTGDDGESSEDQGSSESDVSSRISELEDLPNVEEDLRTIGRDGLIDIVLGPWH